MMLHFLMCEYLRTYQCDLTSSSPLEHWNIDKMVDMMSGSYYTRPRVTSSHDGPPHRSDLCEGCKRGTCRF